MELKAYCISPRPGLTKTLLTMKFTAILMIVACMQVSAGTYSQITIREANAPLKKVFKEIQKQSGYDFLCSYELLQYAGRATVNVNKVTLQEALLTCLKGKDLTFEIVEKTIIIKQMEVDRAKPDIRSDIVPIPPITVKGRIVNQQNEPVSGASIVIKGSTLGTVSDVNGDYTIHIPERNLNGVLVFSFVGYSSIEVPLDGKLTINVALQSVENDLNQVVVMGYGTQRKETVTGSITTVGGDVLKRSPSTSLSNTLAGRLPGLTAVNTYGEPGGDGSVLRVRGNNTLGDNSPLIVVDGIILNSSFDRIDQSDVESIVVLKDASAAIYGARAANGVILVKTKRGRRGKMKVDFTHNEGWIAPTIVPDMADAATFATILNELDVYRNRTPRYSAEDIQKYADGSDPWKYPNTDWYSEVFKPTGSQRYDNLSISGGSENISYFVSGGYKYQGSIYKNSPTNYTQYNFRSNVDIRLSDHIRLGLDLTGNEEKSTYVGTSATDILLGILKSRPVMPAYWPNGLIGPDQEYGINPAIIPTGVTGYNRLKTFNLQSNARLEITVPWVKGLSVTANAASFSRYYNLKRWLQPWHLYYWDFQTYDSNNEPLLIRTKVGPADPSLYQQSDNTTSLTLNAMVNYERDIAEDHHIKLLVGSEKITGDGNSFWAQRRYFVSTALQQMFAGGDLEKDNSGSSTINARLNYFGRVNYDFQQKYLLEFVWRYDGSYIFPEDKRFGFFPGVSVGWQISKEEFWEKNFPTINFLKLRASWGQTGNDRIAEYQYLSSYAFGPEAYIFNVDQENKTLAELRIPNPNVTWEIANQANIGVDGQLYNGKISFAVDFFHNKRSDILIVKNASVPTSTGLTLPPENIGRVSNRGFEIQLGYNNDKHNFRYSISANVGYAKNMIDYWDESPNVPEYQKSTGHPMGSNLYYNAIGIFRDSAQLMAYPRWNGARPGDIIFEDVNKDGTINGLDRVRYYKSTMPTLTGGLNVALEYKSFYLNFLIQGAAGAYQTHYVPSGDGWGNYLQDDIADRWTEENKDASKPRAWSRVDEYWMMDFGVNNTFFLRNNDYLRLKNMEIGFNTPNSFNSKLGVDNIRIYFSGLNLLTLDNLKSSDPEVQNFWAYPINKVYNIGINLTF